PGGAAARVGRTGGRAGAGCGPERGGSANRQAPYALPADAACDAATRAAGGFENPAPSSTSLPLRALSYQSSRAILEIWRRVFWGFDDAGTPPLPLATRCARGEGRCPLSAS